MKRPDFIKNYKEVISEDNCTYPNSDELLSIGAQVGRALGLKKIGVHIETLPPGRRTSWPHANSREDELPYGVEAPHVWIDGHLYELNPGDFVAFPAGTGIAHTFLNNSSENALLLVGGESTKKENKIFYPLHPKCNEEVREKGWLWEDYPERELEPHDGEPE